MIDLKVFTMTKQRAKGLSYGLIAGVSFGTASIIIRFLYQLNPFVIAYLRMFIAAIILLLILFFHKRIILLKSLLHKNSTKVIAMSFFLGLHFVFYIFAVKTTTILNATILVNTVPIQIVIILTLLRRKDLPGKWDTLAIISSFLGIIIISLGKQMTRQEYFEINIGDLGAIIAATFLALHAIVGSDLRKRFDSKEIMMSTYLIGSIIVFTLTCTFFHDSSLVGKITIDTVIWITLLGIIPTAIGHTMYVASLKYLKPYEIATIALLEPISATILALFIFEEIPTFLSIVGGTLIVVSIYLVFKEEHEYL